ncbi:MAG: DUF2207 domain-containing protein, partial [Actinomycetota bacterium]|nr:DUF2207 domain-containing protein [Actinomycetota bacterium]
MRRACVLCLVAGLVWLLTGGTARAKEFTLPEAEVRVKVRADGSVRVTEHITYSFTGSFTGGFREIPLRPGEDLVDAQVSEDGAAYEPGAPTAIGSSGDPGTFGTASTGTGMRIVWHYAATDERRTFTVRYTLVGLAEAWDDVIDVYLQVWGDEWDVELGHLGGEVLVPNPVDDSVRVWGHAAGVDGGTTLLDGGRGASFVAEHVPPHQFVEVRVVFPRTQLTSTEGVKLRDGDRLDYILEQEAELAALTAADVARERWFRDNVAWLVPLALLLAFVPASVVAVWVYRRHGREPRVEPGPQH